MGKQQQHIRIHSASNDPEGPEVKDEPTTDVIKPSVKRDEKTATWNGLDASLGFDLVGAMFESGP